MYLNRFFPGRKEVKFNDSTIPLSLIWQHVAYAYSPEKGLYILRLEVGYQGESYHIRIRRNNSDTAETFAREYNDSIEELELVHKTDVSIH